MSALITYNGITLIDDSPSHDRYGTIHAVDHIAARANIEVIGFPDTTGVEGKVHGVANAQGLALERIFASGGGHRTAIYGTTRAGLLTQINTLMQYHILYAGQGLILAAQNETVAKTMWVDFRPTPPMRVAGFAPGGVTRTHVSDLFFRFIEVN